MTNIRPYTHKDEAALLDIMRRNTPKYFSEEELADLPPYLAKQGKGVNHYVLEVAGVIQGCSGYLWADEGKEGVIAWVMFRPDAQGKGYGWALVGYCLEQLRKSNEMERIVVRTSQFTDVFFAKFGFRTQYTKQDYWAKGYDLVYMEMAA